MTDRRVVFVTGSRRGIGRFLVEHFIRSGCLVEGCSRESPDWELAGYTHHLADVTDEAAIRAVFGAIARRHGRLDVLVNNAGVAAMNHALLTPLATVRRIMDVNVGGTFLASREAAKLMAKRRYGRIVNLTSIATPLRLPGEAAYAASKAAVESLTRVLAYELAEFGVTCNAVGPTAIATDLLRGVPEETIQRLMERLPLRQLGTYSDVAHVIDFFIHPSSSLVTGQVIYLGGAS
jgi:3-oxoacyl-[acyl-carrier protein] reductase